MEWKCKELKEREGRSEGGKEEAIGFREEGRE